MSPVISVEHLSKSYHLGQIGTGTFTNDLKLWWARERGKPNPLAKIGEKDYGPKTDDRRPGLSTVLRPPSDEEIWALKDVSFSVKQGEALGFKGSVWERR